MGKLCTGLPWRSQKEPRADSLEGRGQSTQDFEQQGVCTLLKEEWEACTSSDIGECLG